MIPTRYSPEPITSYRFATVFKFLVEDPIAWDLAYLSWDFESAKKPPDAQFSVNVRRTLQFDLVEGRLDLTGEAPVGNTVRGLFRHPAPRAVKLITELPNLQDLYLFKAYGTAWLDSMQKRVRLYREPHDKNYDFEINLLTQATEVISKIR